MDVSPQVTPIRHLFCYSPKELEGYCLFDILVSIDGRRDGVGDLPIYIRVTGKDKDLFFIFLLNLHFFKFLFGNLDRVALKVDLKNSASLPVTDSLHRPE